MAVAALLPALKFGAQCLALLIGHHRELEVDRGDPVERHDRVVHAVLDLVAQWASGDGQGDEDRHRAVGSRLGAPDHVEVDDRAVQLGILHRTQRLDDLLRRDGHRDDLPVQCARSEATICTIPIGTIPGMAPGVTSSHHSAAVDHARRGSPPRCRRSPTRSATRRDGASTCSSGTTSRPAEIRTGVTASAVAAEVGVHPNVARHHLDKLAAGGYVEVVAPTRP